MSLKVFQLLQYVGEIILQILLQWTDVFCIHTEKAICLSHRNWEDSIACQNLKIATRPKTLAVFCHLTLQQGRNAQFVHGFIPYYIIFYCLDTDQKAVAYENIKRTTWSLLIKSASEAVLQVNMSNFSFKREFGKSRKSIKTSTIPQCELTLLIKDQKLFW